jgi:cell wall assembly regulator SMI1
MTIAQSLQAIEGFAKQQGLTLGLRPGGSDAALDALEKALGLPLPADYRELIKFADGQDKHSFPWMPGCDRLAPVATVAPQLAEERGLASEFPASSDEECEGWTYRGRYFANRLPIAGSQWWDGDVTYLDMAPGPKGKVGQLVTMTSECDFAVLGESLGQALERYAAALASGDLAWHADKKALSLRGEKPFSGHMAYKFAVAK